MATNKLFTSQQAALHSNIVSKIKINREYLMSAKTAGDFNTYLSFKPFKTFNDAYAPNLDKDGNENLEDKSKGPGAPGVRSLFNKAGAVLIGGKPGKERGDVAYEKASAWRISNNAPLMDNRETRSSIRQESDCSVKGLVKASQEGKLGRSTYSFSDFMYCKYLGRVSNNYLVTLRRFPYPVDDYISSIGIGDDRVPSGNPESIGCLVTWMGTPGNDMSNILKYSVSMPYKQMKARLHDDPMDADADKTPANAIASLFDEKYRAQVAQGQAGVVINDYVSKFFPMFDGNPPYPAKQWNSFNNESKVYGPIDVIKDIYMRSDEGLGFEQNISLTFDYELRAYNGINGRQAMLDLLSNILNVTFSTGTFWGGGYRGAGAHQNNIFTNMNIFKNKNTNFTDFVDSFSRDLSGQMKAQSDSWEKAKKENGGAVGALIAMAKKAMNSLGGMLVGGMLNKLGRPRKTMVNSILSPAPVGFWHVTVGNPHHPIMSIGNMILKNTTIEHYGPLGLDDFPTGIKVTCELTRGKGRDIRDIEKLYMHGNDRIYTSMGKKVFDMYMHAQEYKGTITYPSVGDSGDEYASTMDLQLEAAKSQLGSLNGVLKKYFGHDNSKSIMVAAMEQEHGANPKKNKANADLIIKQEAAQKDAIYNEELAKLNAEKQNKLNTAKSSSEKAKINNEYNTKVATLNAQFGK